MRWVPPPDGSPPVPEPGGEDEAVAGEVAVHPVQGRVVGRVQLDLGGGGRRLGAKQSRKE